MRTIKPGGLTPMVRAQSIGYPGRACLTVSYMFRFDDGKLASDGEMWQTISDHGAGMFDVGLPKPRGELVVEGKAFSAKAVPGVQVRASFAALDKRLYVVGDRHWKDGVPTEPEPFEQMPITWSRAFGGEKDRRNPLGRGIDVVELDDGTRAQPLPNVEQPDKLVRSPRERPKPAGFAPTDVMWEPRNKLAGTYGKRWLDTQFPELPEDFDPHFNLVAPEDQWLEQFIQGSEAFRFENMHPSEREIAGALPGWRVRAILRIKGSEEPVDVAMHCDTAWFFPEVQRVALVHRGLFPVPTDDETIVAEALVALEHRERPKPASYYEEIRVLRLDKDKGPVFSLRDSDLLPEDVKLALPPGDDELEPALDHDFALREVMRAKANEALRQSREDMQRAGLDPDAHGMPNEVPPDKEFDTSDLGALFEEVDKMASEAKAEAETHRERAMNDMRQACIDAGLDPDEVMEQRRREALGPPQFSAKKQLETLRGFGTLAGATEIEVPPEVQAQLDDPQLEQKLYQMEAQLLEGYRRAAHYQDPFPRLVGDEAASRRVQVEAHIAGRESLAGRDLTGTDLRGLDFSGMDLAGALLESANVDGCRFDGANLERAVLAHASGTKASFDGARLRHTNLSKGVWGGASFVGADLEEALLQNADLSDADLSKTRLDGVDLTDAKLNGVRLHDAKAKELTAMRVSLAEADLRGAELTFCNFMNVDCRGADFSTCKLDQSAFVDSCADDARFRGASAVNIRVVKAEHGSSFQRCDFRQADLRKAFLRGVDLRGSDLRKAIAMEADFSEANLTGAKLDAIRARESRFERAQLTGASLVAADFMDALLGRSHVAGANFSHANLFRADALRMVGDANTRFTDANLKHLRFVAERGKSGPS